MLIGGKEVNVDLDDPKAIMEALSQLPSGFDSRTAILPYNVDVGDVYPNYCAAMEAWETWNNDRDRDTDLLKEAIEKLETASDSLRERGELLGYACLMEQCMKLRNEIRHYDNLLERVNKTEEIAAENNYGRLLPRIYDSKHKAILHEYKDSIANQQELCDQMQTARIQTIDHMFRASGEAVDHNAVRVEQGEIGLSADKKLGTDNIWECVTVIVRDPITKKTALAHIDIGIDIDSLQIALDRLPKDRSVALEAKIVGASYNDESGNQQSANRSRENLQKVIKFLNGNHVDILSADIMNLTQPRCLVVDPKTFELQEASPRINPNMLQANAMVSLATYNRPLTLAFDLSASPNHAPIGLSRSNIDHIRKNILDKTIIDIAESKHIMFPPNAYNATLAIEADLQLGRSYTEALSQVTQSCEKRIHELRMSGCKISNEEVEKFVAAIESSPLHIGENAEICNRPLIKWINKEGITVKDDKVNFNMDGINNFEFHDPPYTIMENIDRPKSFQSQIAQQDLLKMTNLNKGERNVRQ